MNRIYLFFCLLLLAACGSTETAPRPDWRQIAGRNEDRMPVYRAVVPETWLEIPPEGDLSDTMKPIGEYRFDDLRLVVHNFPSHSLSERIPLQAQIARWQRQLGEGTVTRECRNGFVGLKWETDEAMAWAMQMDPEHYLALTRPGDSIHDQQRRADFTIKVTGPQQSIQRHRNDIEAFARHFELIEPIPSDRGNP